MSIRFTKNQSKILEIFFRNPEKEYYFRELASILGKKPGVFQRDINNLTKMGILQSQYKANSRFFSLNKNYPLYKELKSIFFKTVGVQGQLEKMLIKLKNIKIAFIFGSFAQNKEDSYSDIDLMLIGNPDEDTLVLQISRLERHLDREINYHIFTPADWIKKIRQKDSFLENIIAHPKIFLIGNENELSKIS